MKQLTKNQLLNLLNEVIPQPENITHVDDGTHEKMVTFNWRGIDFTITTSLQVSEKFGQHGHSMLMQELLQWANKERARRNKSNWLV